MSELLVSLSRHNDEKSLERLELRLKSEEAKVAKVARVEIKSF